MVKQFMKSPCPLQKYENLVFLSNRVHCFNLDLKIWAFDFEFQITNKMILIWLLKKMRFFRWWWCKEREQYSTEISDSIASANKEHFVTAGRHWRSNTIASKNWSSDRCNIRIYRFIPTFPRESLLSSFSLYHVFVSKPVKKLEQLLWDIFDIRFLSLPILKDTK